MAGLPQGLIRDGSVLSDKNEWGKFFGLVRFSMRFTIVASSMFSVIIILFARPLATYFLHDTQLSWTIITVALAIPFISVTIIILQLATTLKVVRFSAIVKHFFEPFLKIIFFIVLFLAGFTLGSAIAGFTLTMVFCFIIAAAMVLRLAKKLPRATPDPCDGKALLRYTLPLLGPILFANVMVWIDILLLGYYAENQIVGLFSLALKIMLIPEVIPRSFSLPVTPRLASMIKLKEASEWQLFYKQIGRWVFGLTFPFYLFFIFRSELTLHILSPEFTGGAGYLSILCLGPMFFTLLGPADILLAMAGYSKLQLANATAAFFINVLANILFLPVYGASAMAWVMSGTILFYGLLLGVEVIRIFRFFPISGRMVRVCLSAFPALACMIWVSGSPLFENPHLEFLLEGALFFSIYFLTLMLWAVNAEDRQVMINMVQRIRDHLIEIRRPTQKNKFL